MPLVAARHVCHLPSCVLRQNAFLFGTTGVALPQLHKAVQHLKRHLQVTVASLPQAYLEPGLVDAINDCNDMRNILLQLYVYFWLAPILS